MRYFRAIGAQTAEAAVHTAALLPAASNAAFTPDEAAVAAVVEVLRGAGLVAQPPKALLQAAQDEAPLLARLHAQLQAVLDNDPAAYATRTAELAFLANTLLAGCSIQARPFTAQEASDAAAAICNLGLENWPRHWLPQLSLTGSGLPDRFLVEHDLVRVFQVGWTTLHDEVCMEAAGRLVEVLRHLQCDDRSIQAGLDALRIAMLKQWRAGMPWRARDDLDVITSLDMTAWATLLGLIDECPVIHAAIAASQSAGTHAVSPTAFEFIAGNTQIASARRFLDALPGILKG